MMWFWYLGFRGLTGGFWCFFGGVICRGLDWLAVLVGFGYRFCLWVGFDRIYFLVVAVVGFSFSVVCVDFVV